MTDQEARDFIGRRLSIFAWVVYATATILAIVGISIAVFVKDESSYWLLGLLPFIGIGAAMWAIDRYE